MNNKELLDLLTDLEEYMADKADVEYSYVAERNVGNKEAGLLSRIQDEKETLQQQVIKRIYEFTDNDHAYMLLLNKHVCRVYSKNRHSKQEAEEMAGGAVTKAMKTYGMANVEYNGFVAV